MLLIANALYKWAALLVDKADAGEKESLAWSGAKARSVDGNGRVKGFGLTGRISSEGGPPAHWIELVRRCAPEFISYEGSLLETPTSSLDPEHGKARKEVSPADDPPTGIPVDPPQVSPGRLADQPLNVSETKEFSMAAEVDKGFGRAERGVPDGGAPAHWLELVRRQAPELLFHEDSALAKPTDFFAAENGEAKPETESANDLSARMDADQHQEHPRRFAKGQRDPEPPSAPIDRASFPTDDSSNFSAGSEDRGGYSERNSGEQDFREATPFVVSQEPLSASGDVPSKRNVHPEEPEMPFGDRQRRAYEVGPAAESVQVHEKIPASELKRHIVAEGRGRKENATENLADAVYFWGGLPEPINVLRSTVRTDKTENKGRSDGVSSNHALNEPFFRDSISDGRKSKFKTGGQNPFPANEKGPREEDFQPFNPNRAQDLAWPTLPGEPDRTDPMATSQDRWPALLEEDADLGNQPLNESWPYYSGKTKVAERIRRLDREQRGLGWNE